MEKKIAFALIASVAFGLAACTPTAELDAAPVVVSTPTSQQVTITHIDLLNGLEVKGRAPKTGYDRALFGPAWKDVDRNGCDTRNDILARDLTNVTFKPGTRNCVIATGTLNDPYTGKQISFQRGQGTSQAVQIDHVVALMDAWQKGAQSWDNNKREAFANDPANLLAVDGPANSQKGAGDTATWLPANKAYRCEYVQKQVEIKHAYGLRVTPAEREAMTKILTNCPAAH